MGDCNDNSSCGIELRNLPLLTGCPADDEYFLVGNAEGGAGTGKYARRTWAALKACIGGGANPPLTGVVGGGTSDDPTAGASTFTSSKLIGLGADNNGKILIQIDGQNMYNYGGASSFSFDFTTGEIDISPNQWVTDSALYIDLNQ